MLCPFHPSAKVPWSKGIVAHKNCARLPGFPKTIPQTGLQGAIAGDPSLSNDFSLEVVVSSRTIFFQIACRLFDVLPGKLCVLVVGEKNHLGWVGIPLLQRPHP